MYGSQTGVAESIAKGLHEKIVLANTSGNLETVIVECNRYKRTGLKNGIFDEKRVIIVCSTTGNADAPDNCERFWRYIKRRSHPADLFKGLEYCVLGLGDTNYDKFCYMGEMIDKRLSELGARRFYHLGRADDAVGLDSVVEPWIEGLLKTLNGVTGAGTSTVGLETSAVTALSSNENGINSGVMSEITDFVDDKANLDKNLHDVTNDIGRL